jgi:Phytochelatin synthase
MPRPGRVVGIVGGVTLLVVAAIWSVAFRSPSQHRLPLPSTLISTESPAGAQLLSQSTFTADNSDLHRFFESQSRPAYCGVASSVIVLNALHHGTALTQTTVFPNTSSELRTAFGGMTLAQLGDLLRANGADVTLTYAADSSIDAFRATARQNLQTPGDFILVNYERAALGQSESGHISPLAAYDEKSDRLLILDVAAYKYPPVWVAVADLWNAMNTLDPASRHTRGYATVH